MSFAPCPTTHPEIAPARPSLTPSIAIIHGNRLIADLLHFQCMQWPEWSPFLVRACEIQNIASICRVLPAIILLGHSLPAVDSVALIPKIRSASPGSKIIVLAPQLNEHLVHQLWEHHPQAVLEETEGVEVVAHAIARVQQNGVHFSSRYLELAERLRSVRGTFPMMLTNRERQMMICIAHAMSDEESGLFLSISKTTAKRHRMNIARKLNLRSSPWQLIRFGIEKGFSTAGLKAM